MRRASASARFCLVLLASFCSAATSHAELLPAEAPTDSPRPVIEIIPFVETYAASGALVASGNLTGLLANALQQTGRFDIQLPKEALRDLIQRAQIEESSGLYDLSQLPPSPLLRLQPADIVLQGRVAAVELDQGSRGVGFGSDTRSASILIDISLIEPRTGKLAWAGTATGSANRSDLTNKREKEGDRDDLSLAWLIDIASRRACDDLATQLAATGLFPIRALVIGVTDDGRVHADLGVGSPLKVGEALQVRRISVETDSSTGVALGPRYSEVIGELVIEQILLDRSICRLESGKCQRGDVAEVPENKGD